jgi:hypothetical protein
MEPHHGKTFLRACLAFLLTCEVRAEWLLRNPPNFVTTISALAKTSPNQWIAVGEAGLIRWTDRPYADSRAWVAADSGTRSWLRGAASGNRLWVVVGDRGVLLTSVDRRAWVPQSSGVRENLLAVEAGSDGWMVVGDAGTVLRSTDARLWTRVEVPAVTLNLTSVTRAPSGWAIGGEQGLLLFSANGTRWTEHRLPTREAVSSLRFGKGLWIAAAGRNLFTSPDLTQWTAVAEAHSAFTSLHFSTVHWVAVGLNGVALESADGLKWGPLRFTYVDSLGVTQSVVGSQDFSTVGYDQGIWVMGGLRGDIWTWSQGLSPDRKTYPASVNEAEGSSIRSPFRSIGVQSSEWRLFGDFRTTLYGGGSPSGSWNQQTHGIKTESGGVQDVFGVAAFGPRWISVGAEGGLFESTTRGRQWIRNQDVATRRDLFDVHAANGLWVAVGENGTIRWWEESRPGPHVWQSALLPALEEGISFFGVRHGSSRWVAVGDQGTILNSEDGRTWSIGAQLGLSGHLSSVFHNGRLWVAVGELGNLWTSVDGRRWRRIDLGTEVNLQHVTYGNEQWVAVGDHGSMYGSEDGECWTSVSVPTDVRLWSAEFAVDSWVVAGEGGVGLVWKGKLPLLGPPAGCRAPEEGEVFATLVVREGAEYLRLRWRDSSGHGVLKAAQSLAGPWSEVSVRVTSVGEILQTELPIQLRSLGYYRLVTPE